LLAAEGAEGATGPTGATGSTGAGFGVVYLGNYVSTNGYLTDVAVVRGSDGQLYLAKASGELGNPIDYLTNGQWEIWIPKGADGATGPTGATGATGPGVVAGGTEGQILAKINGTDYNTEWIDNYAESTIYLVRNNTGSTILKGTLVSAVGAEPSGRVDVAPHETTGLQDSELRVMGVATTNISTGANGTVMSFGTLVGIDTRGSTASAIAVGDETWASGDILYAHPTADGKLTNVRPQHDLAVAFITVRHASSGQIAVRIIPGNNHLEWLHDITLDTPADNEVLAYDSAAGVWKNQTPLDIGLVGPTGATGPTGPGASDLTAWTDYTPTITADGGGFSLGNGVASGRYKQIGKTVFFYAKLVYGSTTSPGSGHWNFSLPVTAYNSNFELSASILDDGAAWYGGVGNGNYTGSTTSFAVITPSPTSSVTTWVPVGNGGPFTWTSADNITISGSYEAA
jgi:hypothetical protein